MSDTEYDDKKDNSNIRLDADETVEPFNNETISHGNETERMILQEDIDISGSSNVDNTVRIPSNVDTSVNITSNVDASVNIPSNVDASVNITLNVADNVNILPNINDNVNITSNVDDNVKIPSNVDVSINIPSNVDDNINTTSNVDNNVNTTSNVDDNVNITSNVDDNINIPSNVGENVNISSDTIDNTNIDDTMKIIPTVDDHANIQTNTDGYVSMATNDDDNIYIASNYVDNIMSNVHDDKYTALNHSEQIPMEEDDFTEINNIDESSSEICQTMEKLEANFPNVSSPDYPLQDNEYPQYSQEITTNGYSRACISPESISSHNSYVNNINSFNHNINSSDHNINSSDTNINSPDHNINSPDHNINSSDHNISSSDHNINSSDTNINSSDHNINSSDYNISLDSDSESFQDMQMDVVQYVYTEDIPLVVIPEKETLDESEDIMTHEEAIQSNVTIPESQPTNIPDIEDQHSSFKSMVYENNEILRDQTLPEISTHNSTSTNLYVPPEHDNNLTENNTIEKATYSNLSDKSTIISPHSSSSTSMESKSNSIHEISNISLDITTTEDNEYPIESSKIKDDLTVNDFSSIERAEDKEDRNYNEIQQEIQMGDSDNYGKKVILKGEAILSIENNHSSPVFPSNSVLPSEEGEEKVEKEKHDEEEANSSIEIKLILPGEELDKHLNKQHINKVSKTNISEPEINYSPSGIELQANRKEETHEITLDDKYISIGENTKPLLELENNLINVSNNNTESILTSTTASIECADDRLTFNSHSESETNLTIIDFTRRDNDVNSESTKSENIHPSISTASSVGVEEVDIQQPAFERYPKEQDTPRSCSPSKHAALGSATQTIAFHDSKNVVERRISEINRTVDDREEIPKRHPLSSYKQTWHVGSKRGKRTNSSCKIKTNTPIIAAKRKKVSRPSFNIQKIDADIEESQILARNEKVLERYRRAERRAAYADPSMDSANKSNNKKSKGKKRHMEDDSEIQNADEGISPAEKKKKQL